jgi:hypothetical protein
MVEIILHYFMVNVLIKFGGALGSRTLLADFRDRPPSNEHAPKLLIILAEAVRFELTRPFGVSCLANKWTPHSSFRFR